MPSTAVISILCRDRIGLVATISETVVDMGRKVSDMTASVLGKGIVCVVISLWPDKEPPVSEIRKRINDLPGLNAANVQVDTFDLLSFSFDSIEKTSHRIRCRRLNDNRGDLGALCGTFADFKANLVRVHAERHRTGKDWEFTINMEVDIPKKEAKDYLEAIKSTAKRLGYSLMWEVKKETG